MRAAARCCALGLGWFAGSLAPGAGATAGAVVPHAAAAFCAAPPGVPGAGAHLLRHPAARPPPTASRLPRPAQVAAAPPGSGQAGGADAALLTAAEAGDAAGVQRALAGGASAAAANDWGTTCLQDSVKGGHAEVTRRPTSIWSVRACDGCR